jgi:hypothetical protein
LSLTSLVAFRRTGITSDRFMKSSFKINLKYSRNYEKKS